MPLATNNSEFLDNFLKGFKGLELGDKKIIESYLVKFPPEISELTFTNIFSWKEAYNFKFRIFKNALLIGSFLRGKIYFFYPIGSANQAELIREILKNSGSGINFFRIPAALGEFLSNDKGFQIDDDRNNYDYIYKTSDLVTLKGKKFDAKRNFIRRFKDNFKYLYFEVTPGLINRCLEFESVWCSDKECDSVLSLRQERLAFQNMLKNFSHLNIRGGAIEVDGRIIALSLGGKLNKDTFVIHVEKASASYPGAYQVINREFLNRAALDFKYVNREQDLGVAGIRKAKLSYHPVSLLKKFTIGFKN